MASLSLILLHVAPFYFALNQLAGSCYMLVHFAPRLLHRRVPFFMAFGSHRRTVCRGNSLMCEVRQALHVPLDMLASQSREKIKLCPFVSFCFVSLKLMLFCSVYWFVSQSLAVIRCVLLRLVSFALFRCVWLAYLRFAILCSSFVSLDLGLFYFILPHLD